MEGENDEMGIASYRERSLLNYKMQLPVLLFLTTVPARNGPFGSKISHKTENY